MADLLIGSGVPGSSGTTGMPATRRPSAAPAPSSSPSGIRGPRVIMQERAAREAARQRAEAEQQAMERSRAEQEARLMDDSRRRAERRAAAIGPEQGGTTDMPHFHDPRLGQAYAAISQAQGVSGISAHAPQAQLRPDPSHIPAGHTSPTYAPPLQGSQKHQQQQQQQQPSHGVAETRAGESATHGTDAPKPKNAFPHAFERWEILSAHWEGLTSYWIRKLEQNKEEISRDPMSQQLARQVTDLSAAGANLFHAVVELQRLRASSERKFQRWFFETRSELERSHEVNAMLEAALDRERRGRDQAIQEAVDHERGISKTQKQIIEMRKELSISKDEARRAWEELGRREQEERDRTYSLQTGQPTIVGGVQVVPMTQSTPSRHASTRDPASYQSDYSTRPTYSIDQQAAAQAHAQARASPVGGSGIGIGGGSTSSTPHQSHGGGGGGGSGAQDTSRRGAGGSESGYSEGEYLIDTQGNFILDPHGKRIAVALLPSSYAGSDAEVDDYDTPATTNPPSGGFDAAAGIVGAGSHPHPQAHPQAQWTGEPAQDYTGQGYGGTGWEAVPRHHHPTRLSDVIEEEDERSRTSGGRSRG